MIFSLIIHSHPLSQASLNAYEFAKAAAKDHSLYRVFFYQDGAYHGSSSAQPLRDQLNLSELWASLAKEHAIDLVVCIAAGVKRGVLNNEESNRYLLPSSTIKTAYSLNGMGDMVDATLKSDRVITFGG